LFAPGAVSFRLKRLELASSFSLAGQNRLPQGAEARILTMIALAIGAALAITGETQMQLSVL
jgi:hypothetical protein